MFARPCFKLEIRNFTRTENLYFTVFQSVVVGAVKR